MEENPTAFSTLLNNSYKYTHALIFFILQVQNGTFVLQSVPKLAMTQIVAKVLKLLCLVPLKRDISDI